MKKFALAFWLLSYDAWAAAPVVSDVHGSQDAASGKVQIFYNLADSDTPKLQVTLQVSADGGNTWAVPASSLSGSGIGDAVTPGTGKLIVWDAKADWPGQVSNQVRFKVNATDTPVPPAPAGMALIPAGSFQIGDSLGDSYGSETPVHAVNVSAFYMEKNLVTKAQWDGVTSWAATNGYTFDSNIQGEGPHGQGKAADHPVQTVNWWDCVKWCNARSEKERLVPCYTVGGSTYKTGQANPVCNFSASGYRLPTEAEWEKAARGGLSGHRFPWGDTISWSQANYYTYGYWPIYDLNSGITYNPKYCDGVYPYTSPVGSFAANGYGLYDMAGNMSEWCWDWYGSYESGSASDPTGLVSGSSRVIRGGSWCFTPDGCRVTSRGSYYPVSSYNFIGFRCARSSVP